MATATLAVLENITKGIEYLASDKFKGKLTKNLMQEALEQVDLGFAESRDPYGRRWQPLKHRRGQPLRDTGRLQRSFNRNSSSDPDGFSIGTNVIYANVHQFGHTFAARRQAVTRKGRFKKNAQATARTKNRSIGARVVPARPMLPNGALGVIWTRAMRKAAQALADKEAP